MNVLITTFSLLLVLSVGASLFWKEALSSSFSIRAIKGIYEAKRSAKNTVEQKWFARLKDPAAPPKKGKGKGQRTLAFRSHRFETPPIEQGRLAIGGIRVLEYRTLLKPLLQRFLAELYGHTAWYEKKTASRILDKFAETTGEVEELSFVKELDEAEYRLWYLMRKGTQSYDLATKTGYPPLEDYFDFNPRQIKHTCNFPFASFPLLKALLGEELATEILRIEKSKWEKDHRRRFCLKKELLPLITSKQNSPELTALVETFCSFGQSIGKRSYVEGKEEKSGIVIRRNLAESQL